MCEGSPAVSPAWMRSTSSAIASALLAVALAALASGCAHYEIVGYYAGWKAHEAIDGRDLTVINYAFVDLAPDGSLVLGDPAVDIAHFAALRKLREANPALCLMAS